MSAIDETLCRMSADGDKVIERTLDTIAGLAEFLSALEHPPFRWLFITSMCALRTRVAAPRLVAVPIAAC